MMYNELKYGKSVIWYYDIWPEPLVANEMIRLQYAFFQALSDNMCRPVKTSSYRPFCWGVKGQAKYTTCPQRLILLLQITAFSEF